MTEQPIRAKLLANPADVLKTLPQIGKLMINSKNGGATHERIGVVQNVIIDGNWIFFTGDEHNSKIALNAIHTMIADRSSIMQEKVYPRIDLLAEDDEVIGSVIGFGGAEPFDAALASFALEELAPKTDSRSMGDQVEVGDSDPALKPFAAAQRNKGTVRIALERPTFQQEWTGEMPDIRNSRGFINVMKPDFHLHLKVGHVMDWRIEEKDGQLHYYALDADGQSTGLVVSGTKEAFA
ncbi:hypothetical protein ACI0FM_14375 [Paenochrobactrum sp. BZR 588]|uniref:hypothetical protein n=1 Tax=unclassified Paenochrobactrum TaxID=2639760 RepID=UPI0038541A44